MRTTMGPVVAAALLATACGSDTMGEFAGGGDLGATPGGAKDIGYARQVIEGGGIPSSDQLPVEGLLSEHDLPVEGPPCESALCVRPALAVAPSLETGKPEKWVQIALTTGVDMADFRRPPLDLVVAIDRSGSMSGDLAQTTEAVSRLISHLREDDRIAVLAMDDDVTTVHAFGPVGKATSLQAQVHALEAHGGLDFEAGLGAAFRVADGIPADPGRMRRVIVLACGYPVTAPFDAAVRSRADRGISTTFVGVLLGFNGAVQKTLGEAAGGSYHFTGSLEAIEKVFDDEFDLNMTPVAYGLHFSMELNPGLEPARLYGIPGDAAGEPRPQFDVATAFFSKRHGAIVMRVSGDVREDEVTTLGTAHLSYRPETALGLADAGPQAEALALPPGDVGAVRYGGPGVRKAVALVNMAERMQAACDVAVQHRDEAKAIVDELATYLAAEAEALDADDLRTEVALVRKLRENLDR